MRRSFLLIGLLTVAARGGGAQVLRRTCLRFDRPYFAWHFRDSTGSYWPDSSSVIALDTSAMRGAAGARRLDPLSRYGHDAWRRSLWSSSYWRAGAGDSVEIVWTTLLTGSHFLLVGVDTLRGTVEEFGDVIAVDSAGREIPGPPPRRILVVKTPCPK
jgi:hypothetical protein